MPFEPAIELTIASRESLVVKQQRVATVIVRSHVPCSLRDRLRLQFPPAALGFASLSLFGAEGGTAGQAPPTPTLPEVRVEDAPDTGFRTDTTRSGTRTETPLRDIPQFINIVPQALIRSQNATTLQDALRNVPGISYAAAEGGTQANQVFFLRGFPLNQDIFIDGVRDLGEYNRDLFATESVEVLKGSSALMFGRGSTGGVDQPDRRKVADRLERREVGADARLVRPEARDRRPQLPHRRVERRAPGRRWPRIPDSYRYPQDVEKLGFAPSFWMNVGKATDLTLSYYYLKAKDVTDYGQPTLFTAATGFFGFPPVSPRKLLRLREPRLRELRDAHRDVRRSSISSATALSACATRCAGRTTSANRNRRSRR